MPISKDSQDWSSLEGSKGITKAQICHISYQYFLPSSIRSASFPEVEGDVLVSQLTVTHRAAPRPLLLYVKK